MKTSALIASFLAAATAFGGVLDKAWIKEPTGLAKLWNNIPGNKEIRWVQGSQHGYVPPAYEGRDFVRGQE